MMGMRSVAYETVLVEAPAPQGEPPAPDEPPVPEAVPDVDPVAAVPEPEPVLFDPDVEPLVLEPLVLEPLPFELPLLLQATPTAMEARVAKERILDVARCMKTVLSA
jgi:hypothetical protein